MTSGEYFHWSPRFPGLFDGATYDGSTIAMQGGDIFVAFSDGVTEPENEIGASAKNSSSNSSRRIVTSPSPASVMSSPIPWRIGSAPPSNPMM
ncbi:MAG TPA: hypothetical protein VJA94_07220 [Candidatus Angelobacter sp.]